MLNTIKLISHILLVIAVCFSCNKDEGENAIPTVDSDDRQENVFESQQLTSNIYIISEDVSGNKVNISILTGDDGNLLIDTGFKNVCQTLKDSVKQINSDSIKIIINTHYHSDHSGGNAIIEKNGIIVGHEKDSYLTQDANPEAQIVTFSDEYTINFNNETIQCFTMPVIGHLQSDIIIYFVSSNVLFLGDLYLPQSFPSINVEKNNASVQNWITNVESISSQFPSDVIIVPGHGPVSTMEEFIAYTDLMKKTSGIVVTHINQGKTYNEIVMDDVLEEWKEYGATLRGLTAEYWIKAICDSYAL